MLSKLTRTLQDKCAFILVKDNLKNDGRNLFNSVVMLHLKSQKVDYIMYDHSPNVLPPLMATSENINVIDVFSDPFSWREINSPDYALIDVNNLSHTANSVLVIDSLSTLLVHNSASELYSSFHNMLKSGSKLITILHEDCHTSKDSHMLEALASAILELSADAENTVYYTNKLSSGKVTQENISMEINSTYDIVSVKSVELTPSSVVTKQPDPTANLTFNLNLKDSEKESRKNVQLPFLKKNMEEVHEPAIGTEFNEDDFYDEDDPDDDLAF